MNRNIFLLLQGQFVSRLGTQIALTATVFWLTQSIGSASLVGLLLAGCAAPTVLLGPFGGTCADRYSRRGIIVYSDVICGVATLALASLTWILPLKSMAVVGSILLVNILLASVHAFFLPAVSAAIPDLMPKHEIAMGMSLMQGSGAVATMAGQALGGLLLPLGAPLLFCIDGLTYMFTAFAESRIVLAPRVRHDVVSGWKTFWAETISGFQYVWSRRPMRKLFLSAVPLNVLVVPIFVLMPFYTTGILHRGAEWYGYLTSAFSAGSMVGYVLAGVLRLDGSHRFVSVSGSVLLTSGLLGVLGWIADSWLAMAVLSCLGLLIGWVSITGVTILQQATEENSRGRVFGLLFTLSQGLTPLAMLLAGIAADLTGNNLRLIFSVCGLFSLVIALNLSRSSELREFFVHSCSIDPDDGCH